MAWVTFFLALSSPFAINYATTARMYSLMILWSVLGFLALTRALEEPRPGRLVALGAVTAAMLYTHYWGLYLVLVTGAWLAWQDLANRSRAVAHCAPSIIGALFFLPWSPVFVFQALHTGTPWTSPASAADLLGVFGDFAGGGPWGGLLMFATFALFLLGVFGRTVVPGTPVDTVGADGSDQSAAEPGRAVMLELRPRPAMGPLAGVAVGTLLLAVGPRRPRQLPPSWLATPRSCFPCSCWWWRPAWRCCPGDGSGSAAWPCSSVAGLLTGLGRERAAADPGRPGRRRAQRAGPARRPGGLLPRPARARRSTVCSGCRGVTEITFPRAIGPQRVDWVDYKKVIADTDVDAFAEAALARLGAGHTLWLV